MRFVGFFGVFFVSKQLSYILFFLRTSASTQHSTKYFAEPVRDGRLKKILQIGDIPEGAGKESLAMESQEQRKCTPSKKTQTQEDKQKQNRQHHKKW